MHLRHKRCKRRMASLGNGAPSRIWLNFDSVDLVDSADWCPPGFHQGVYIYIYNNIIYIYFEIGFKDV
jgi:hypothetical protein